jgi:hypothetical protein
MSPARAARIVLAAPAVALAAAGAASCGLGPGPGTGEVNLNVTRDFGARTVKSVTRAHVPGSETVMRMLERTLPVSIRYGGGFVESIGGLSGGSHLDWFYYVNGVEAPSGAAGTAVHRGDRIWWDLHDWTATNTVPAVVGSFPEPFVHGVGGKRLPVTIECGSQVQAACDRVSATLSAIHVPLASQLIGTGSGSDTIGVVVAPWREVIAEVAASLIAHGPSASGVYARFIGKTGGSLALLDPSARVVTTLGAGAGLIAATRDKLSEPTWFVTGTDAAGVLAASRAFNEAQLHNRFALAVQGPRLWPLPVGGP